MVFSLTELKVRSKARCVSLCDDCPSSFKKKLLAMGLIPGVLVRLLRIAPLGCPLEIEVLGGRYFLRKTEAACIFVEGVA